jgi:Flp pilus assembly protein TadG
VEFAIAAPLLVLLLFGIIEFGRFFFLYNNLSNAAREGARLGAITPAGTTAERTAATSTVIALVRARIADAGAATADVQVTLPQNGQPHQTVRVRINDFPFLRVVPFIAPTRFPDIEAEFRYELQ